jgi:hypothetical protein
VRRPALQRARLVVAEQAAVRRRAARAAGSAVRAGARHLLQQRRAAAGAAVQHGALRHVAREHVRRWRRRRLALLQQLAQLALGGHLFGGAGFARRSALVVSCAACVPQRWRDAALRRCTHRRGNGDAHHGGGDGGGGERGALEQPRAAHGGGCLL